MSAALFVGLWAPRYTGEVLCQYATRISLSLLAIAGCSSTKSAGPTGGAAPSDRPAESAEGHAASASGQISDDAAPDLPSCCAGFDDVQRLDGKAVRLRGLYKKTVVSKRPIPPDLTTPGRAAIETEGPHIMLEVYYEDAGLRSLEEIQRFHGKPVVVTGTLHAATPTQTHEGMPLQTMIGPYISVESIALEE